MSAATTVRTQQPAVRTPQPARTGLVTVRMHGRAGCAVMISHPDPLPGLLRRLAATADEFARRGCALRGASVARVDRAPDGNGRHAAFSQGDPVAIALGLLDSRPIPLSG